MLASRQLSYVFITLSLITIALLVAFDLLGIKRLQVWPPTTGYTTYLLPNNAESPNVYAVWIDEAAASWECQFEATAIESDYCSFYMDFDSATEKGLDLTSYEKIRLNIHHEGEATHLALVLRNHGEHYSTPDDDNSTKYMSTLLTTRELIQGEIEIPLKDFVTADWWITEYNTDRDNSFPDFDNIVSLAINMSEGKRTGRNRFVIKSIVFEGHAIKKEKFNLYLLLSWVIFVFSIASLNLFSLYKERARKDHQIKELNKSNSKLAAERESYRKLSTVDPLTNALNRFGIDNFVKDIYQKLATSPHDTFSIVLADIDHFKRINDRRGHDVGDQVLKSFSDIITRNIEEVGVLGRWGGEEFLIILPDFKLNQALNLAERIREETFTHCFFETDHLAVSASFGIAEVQKDEDFSCLFKRTDEALYEAKSIGRNCCVHAKIPTQ